MQRFVELYLVSLNATKAYKEAYGCSETIAGANGTRLLGNAKVAAAIEAAMQKREQRTEITQDQVLQQLWATATADPRDLVEYRRTCCRHCWSANHRYQFTQHEWDERLTQARALFGKTESKKRGATFVEPDPLGGVGFDARRDPNPACPECFGQGVERTYIHDTRRLSSTAALLYAGVKQTKEGIEVRMRDQQAALIKVAEHLGMFRPVSTERQTADEVAAAVRMALRSMREADGLPAT